MFGGTNTVICETPIHKAAVMAFRIFPDRLLAFCAGKIQSKRERM